MSVEPPLLAFCLAAAAHAGFQLTVTTVVYPALARVGQPHWTEAHARHSTAIAPLVVLVYGALVATGAWAVTADRSLATVTAAVAATACLAVTAAVAAPTHGRLTDPDPVLLRRLLFADRVRAVLALACLAAAAAALSGA